MNCSQCAAPLARRADPPSAGGFEFTLYECPACHQHAMYCYCVATGTGAWEPITAADVAEILSENYSDLRGFMKAWQAKVIG